MRLKPVFTGLKIVLPILLLANTFVDFTQAEPLPYADIHAPSILLKFWPLMKISKNCLYPLWYLSM